MNPALAAHAAAILTILIWGATFTSTKVLLQAFAPVEILFLRFLLGACALLLACPRLLHVRDRRREATFALAGLCGVTLYFLLENIALSYSTASNVGVLVGICWPASSWARACIPAFSWASSAPCPASSASPSTAMPCSGSTRWAMSWPCWRP